MAVDDTSLSQHRGTHRRSPPLRRPRPRRSAARRTATGFARLCILLVLAVAAGFSFTVWRLSRGPISFARVADQGAELLARQFGEGFHVDIARAQLAWENGPVLTLSDVVVKDRDRHTVVMAPRAEIVFDPMTLVRGNMVPREISFVGLAVTLTIAPDGSVTVSAAEPAERAGAAAPDAPLQPAPATPPDTRFGPGRLIDAVTAGTGPIAVLQRAGIRDGRLRIDDRRRGRSMVFDQLAMSYARPAAHETLLSLHARGAEGPIDFTASIAGEPGARRSLTASTRDLALKELVAIADPGTVPFATDIKASASLALTVEADDTVSGFEASVTGGSGTLLLDDPDARPFPVERLGLKLGWDAARHGVVVQDLSLKSWSTDLRFAGTLDPPSDTRDHWALALSLAGPANTWTAVRNDPAIRLDRFDVQARLPLGLGSLIVDSVAVKGPEVDFRLSAGFGRDGDFEGMRMEGTAGPMPARTLMAFWPNYLTRDVRDYLIDATRGGTVDRFSIRTAMTPQQMADAKAKKPLPASVMTLDAALSGMAVRLSPGVPMVTDGMADAHVTGRRAEIAISRGRVATAPGQNLLLGQGRYVVADTSLKPAVAQVDFGIAGELEPLIDLLRSDGMKPFAALPAALPALRGQVEAKVGLTLTLVPKMGPKDVVVQVQGSASGVTADAVFGKDRLEAGAFELTQDRSGLVVKGDARIGGAPATIDVRQPAGAPVAETNVVLTLDEAARARRNIKLPGTLSGPVDVHVALKDVAPGKPAPPRIEIDLAKAGISDLLPGWTKPAGKAAKAAFKWVEDDGTVLLDDFALDGGGPVSARGSIRLDDAGGFLAARLTSLRVSSGDDVAVQAEKTQGGVKVSLRGSALDARPVLKAVMSPGGPPATPAGDLDLDLKIAAVTGQNGEALTGAELKLATRGGDVRDFRLAGRLGGGAIAGQMGRGETGASGMVIEGADAGAFFRYLDIYKRMRGGALLLQLAGGSPRMNGLLTVSRFVLDDEPALARSVRPGDDAQPGSGPNRVSFTKLKAGFAVGGGQLRFSDATMWGPTVGGTLDGTMDFARDRVDLSGTFVPAYGLNNMFNRVPIVGPLLGGGQNEGLFAVNFRITGRVTQPTLTINPLSAVAPGFLRKFFGVLGPDATSSTAPNPGEAK